ncbi:YheC/YheD family endospore coat-associated protein [Paenibacillus alkalitolerans]|uniref:YheC/YheD family endospore coat-associated protein n=1 Tax=Paenibacillus alkalitolerans TaxID=2799335 RepID=UPI0018F483DE|nr:YheC/YheD family protein [Paenibacillus alkalitolerans]
MSDRNVGVLINNNMLRGIPRGRTGHEKISFYEESAREYDITPVYFRLQDISMQDEKVKALVFENGSYRWRKLPLPKVIHNRALYFKNPSANRKLENLCSKKGRIVFNRWNRYGKLFVHRLLMQREDLRPHLPETMKATVKSVRALSSKHEAVIVKPSSSSIGKGIMKVDRIGTRWRLTYPSGLRKGSSLWKSVDFKFKLPAVLRTNIVRKPHVAQQRLNLATYLGRPFDMRVSVQRGLDGKWQMTGIAAKVAKKNVFVTNVAQGGTVYRLDDVLRDLPHLNPLAVRESIERFSLSAAEHLSTRLPYLSDIGFDIGITPEGYPVFIEMNLRDLRYSFREGGMMEEWKRTYANPLAYARYLLDGNEPG